MQEPFSEPKDLFQLVLNKSLKDLKHKMSATLLSCNQQERETKTTHSHKKNCHLYNKPVGDEPNEKK